VSRCIGRVVNKTRRLLTSCVTLTTVERVVAECTHSLLHIGHCGEKNHGVD